MEKLYYKEYYHLERSHWWFKARLEILEKLMQKFIVNKERTEIKILNAGAATGATSQMLQKYGNVASLEYDKECSIFLSKILGEEVVNASLTELPFEDKSFDLICAYDVIEHIENDQLAIQEIHRVLKDNGKIFLTVPAFQFLWSHHDVVNHHYRRYTAGSMLKLLKTNGFNIEFGSYFNFLLFLPISAVRILSKILTIRKSTNSTGSDFEKFNHGGFANKFLYRLFKSESIILNKKISFPIGVSFVVIGSK